MDDPVEHGNRLTLIEGGLMGQESQQTGPDDEIRLDRLLQDLERMIRGVMSFENVDPSIITVRIFVPPRPFGLREEFKAGDSTTPIGFSFDIENGSLTTYLRTKGGEGKSKRYGTGYFPGEWSLP